MPLGGTPTVRHDWREYAEFVFQERYGLYGYTADDPMPYAPPIRLPGRGG